VPPIPSPLVSPGLVSPAKRYSGSPMYVTCTTPLARAAIPRLLCVTPVPAVAGPTSAGQVAAQAPVHVLTLEWSAVNRYNAWLLPLTITCVPFSSATLTIVVAAPGGTAARVVAVGAGRPLGVGLGDGLAEGLVDGLNDGLAGAVVPDVDGNGKGWINDGRILVGKTWVGLECGGLISVGLMCVGRMCGGGWTAVWPPDGMTAGALLTRCDAGLDPLAADVAKPVAVNATASKVAPIANPRPRMIALGSVDWDRSDYPSSVRTFASRFGSMAC